MTDVNQDPAKLAAFQSNAQSIATAFVLDVEDVRQAYGTKPDTLNALFNAMSGAQKYHGLSKGSTIFFGFLTAASLPAAFTGFPVVPAAITAYSGLKWKEKSDTIKAVQNAVCNQIALTRPPTPVPAAA